MQKGIQCTGLLKHLINIDNLFYHHATVFPGNNLCLLYIYFIYISKPDDQIPDACIATCSGSYLI